MRSTSTNDCPEPPYPSQAHASARWKFDISAYFYIAALAGAIALWLLAIRSPLWLDETGSYWQISGTLHDIWARQIETLAFPTYAWVLWASSKVLGTSEVALRIPSVLGMTAAAYFLYRAARVFFGWDLALVATVLFCVNPITVVEASDARPYAISVLVTNAAIVILLRMRRNRSVWAPALLGVLAALIVSLQFLFATIVPALLICLILFQRKNIHLLCRQIGTASATFMLASIPLVPGLRELLIHKQSHVFESAPEIGQLIWTLIPGLLACAFILAIPIGVLVSHHRPVRQELRIANQDIAAFAALALVPLFILYGVSAWTPIHMFSARHRLIAIPGLALLWTAVVGYFPRATRPFFCVILVLMTILGAVRSPLYWHHGYSWKAAIQAAETNASVDDAPVLMCSDFPEADYASMPLGHAKESKLFSPLSYYPLSVPVVPLPRALNKEAIRVGSQFLTQAIEVHERFLAMANVPSYETLHWLKENSSRRYETRLIGVFDGVAVLEFTPKPDIAAR